MVSKDDIIRKIYFDEAGYGGIKQTYEDARKKIKLLITMM